MMTAENTRQWQAPQYLNQGFQREDRAERSREAPHARTSLESAAVLMDWWEDWTYEWPPSPEVVWVWEYLWDLPNHAIYFLAKRCLDICLSAPALLLLSPLLLALACLIKLADRGPILSWCVVAGRDGVPLRVPRFRTTVHADSPETTRIGRVLRRFGLDNLPQLWTILRGQMTFVGPACMPLADLVRWGAFAQMRQCVPPGLTGLAQIRKAAGSTFDERMYLDREYLLTCSLRRDLLILLGSVPAMLRRGDGRGDGRVRRVREYLCEPLTISEAARPSKDMTYADS